MVQAGGDAVSDFDKAARKLMQIRGRLLEQSIALLGVCGWFPDRLEWHPHKQETMVWQHNRLLAIVGTEWPLNDTKIRFTLRFAVAPLRELT